MWYPRTDPRRRRPLTRSVALALAAIAGNSAAATAWRFDLPHSQILFSVDHQGYSSALGRLHIKDGIFTFSGRDWASARVDVVIDMTSVDLGDASLDAAARSSALLDTARWPTARYTSTRVEARDADHAIVHGQLHWRGHQQPVDLAVTLNRIAPDPYSLRRKSGFSATATFARENFGMARHANAIGNLVTLRIEVEGVRSRHTEIPDDPQE